MMKIEIKMCKLDSGSRAPNSVAAKSAVDDVCPFATFASMNSGCFAFDFSFVGAFYFWPGCLRARLR